MTTVLGTRTDEQIQRDVQQELKWEAELQPNEIGVIAKDAVVTLTGYVDSYLKKWSAEKAALRVRGVTAVANDIEVRLPASAERIDPDIAAAALRAIEWDTLIKSDDIKISVSNGWVTLHGQVKWNHERLEAERVVRRLTGVRGVTNRIALKTQAIAPPDKVKANVADALVRAAETDARGITVDVKGTKVILKGKVHSIAEKRTAERVAWSAQGVTDVDNKLKIAWFAD